MKKLTIESFTKFNANLDEIMGNVDEMDQLLNSREFITTLITDLISGKRNVVEWQLVDGHGKSEDVDSDSLKDEFGINYSFEFKYRFKDQVIPLTIFIAGDVKLIKTPYRSASYLQPAEGGGNEVDFNDLGRELDLSLYDKDGSEINIKWLTPDLKKKVTREIIKDYV